MFSARKSLRITALAAAAATVLSACEGDIVSSPRSTGPTHHLADYLIDQDPSNVTVVPGFFKVCKVGPPGYVATFDVVEYEWKAQAQRYDSITAVVQVQPGTCKLVAQNIPDPWVRVTERTQPGIVLDSIRLTYQREVSNAPRGTPGGGFHIDPTNGTYTITDSATVVAAIGVASTPEDGSQWPQYRSAGAVAIFFNSLDELLGGEGCTPGYWKNHTDSWAGAGLSTGATLESVFDVPDALGIDDVTLLQALQGGGGPGVSGASRTLLRAAVAALLNARHPGVDYALYSSAIISSVNAALATGSRDAILALATSLDNGNNAGCTLS